VARRKGEISPAQLKKQAAEILEKAKAKGAEQSYMFLTAFQRYQEHLEHLTELQKAIQEAGILVEKEYVKGRKNIYVNPAITAYNATASAADKTAQVLLKYIEVAPDPADRALDAFDLF